MNSLVLTARGQAADWSVRGAAGPRDAPNTPGFDSRSNCYVTLAGGAADRAKQHDTELSADEAVDDDVDRRVDGQHQVDDDVCVPQRTYRHRDRDIDVKYVADASGYGRRLAYDEEDDDHYHYPRVRRPLPVSSSSCSCILEYKF